MAIGDGARLGVIECYCDSVQIPLVVLQEVSRLVKDSEIQNFDWVENAEYFDFDMGRMKFAARKLEGGFEEEWRQEVEKSVEAFVVNMTIPRTHLLSSINQALVVSNDVVSLKTEDGKLVVEANGEGGERAVAKTVIVDLEGSASGVYVSGLDLREALTAKRDPSVELKICDKFVKVSDTQGFEILIRQIA